MRPDVTASRTTTVRTPVSGAVVTLEGATVRLGGVTVLRDLDLALREGELVTLTGPNGSGKTTLLRVLAGLAPLSHGRLLRNSVQGSPPRPWRSAIIGHEVALSSSLTVRENLDLIATLLGRERAAVSRALIRVGLTGAADRPVSACSQGMARRAELARALLTGPELLLLDEVHAALDPEARGLAVDVARSVTDRGGCAVLVTHDVAALGTKPTRLLRVCAGQVEEQA